MVKDLSRRSEREGTRTLMLGGAAIAVVLVLVMLVWLGLPHLFDIADYVGRPATGAGRGTAQTTIGNGVPAQGEAESALAKNDPAGNEDATGGRARRIKQTSEAVSLTQQQRDSLRTIFGNAHGPKVERANFEMMIGTLVPQQVQLADLPPEATQVLNGYWGDEYLVAGSDLVVVDQHSRRVAAIISGVE